MVTEIIYQPISAQLLAAYRPIRLQVLATGTFGNAVPPFVSCDIYIDGTYYKSMLRTAPDLITAAYGQFSFDIADAMQEYMQPDIAVIDNHNVLVAPHMSAKVYCKFRASDIDANGFTIEEETVPVQGTRFTDPVAGTGLVSNSFWVINAALQHEDNQNLASHLSAYKGGGWAETAYPLSHRQKYFFCPNDSDHFPVIVLGPCVSTDLVMHYRYKGDLATQTATAIDINTCDPITFTFEVVANQVTVTLDEAIPAGQYVLVRYRKKDTVGAEWIDAGTFTTQTIEFAISNTGQPYVFPGDYDLQVIRFCSSCISADPVTDTVNMSGEVTFTEWIGMTPFCVVQDFPGPVYVTLEVRNSTEEQLYSPSATVKNSLRTTNTGELYAKFFSDANHLTPVSITQAGLKVVVKKVETWQQVNSLNTWNKVIETIETYNVDTDGTEVLLGTVTNSDKLEIYGPYPTVTGSTTSDFTYSMFPTHVLSEGNTGYSGFEQLQEVSTSSGMPTGQIKNNVEGEDDYIAPALDPSTCPQGPDRSAVTYNGKLQVAKVEFNYKTSFVFAPAVADTQLGGYQYMLNLPSNTTTHISVKAHTLDAGNTTGKITVRVTYWKNGADVTDTYTVKDNIETKLPGLFRNIVSVNLSNF